MIDYIAWKNFCCRTLRKAKLYLQDYKGNAPQPKIEPETGNYQMSLSCPPLCV
jgi:hypothetical protein